MFRLEPLRVLVSSEYSCLVFGLPRSPTSAASSPRPPRCSPISQYVGSTWQTISLTNSSIWRTTTSTCRTTRMPSKRRLTLPVWRVKASSRCTCPTPTSAVAAVRRPPRRLPLPPKRLLYRHRLLPQPRHLRRRRDHAIQADDLIPRLPLRRRQPSRTVAIIENRAIGRPLRHSSPMPKIWISKSSSYNARHRSLSDRSSSVSNA